MAWRAGGRDGHRRTPGGVDGQRDPGQLVQLPDHGAPRRLPAAAGTRRAGGAAPLRRVPRGRARGRRMARARGVPGAARLVVGVASARHGVAHAAGACGVCAVRGGARLCRHVLLRGAAPAGVVGAECIARRPEPDRDAAALAVRRCERGAGRRDGGGPLPRHPALGRGRAHARQGVAPAGDGRCRGRYRARVRLCPCELRVVAGLLARRRAVCRSGAVGAGVPAIRACPDGGLSLHLRPVPVRVVRDGG